MKFTVKEITNLINYLKDESLTMEDISQKMNRSIPSLEQKAAEQAVKEINRGRDKDEIIKEYRVREQDLEVLMGIENPKIQRIKELVDELQYLLKGLH